MNGGSNPRLSPDFVAMSRTMASGDGFYIANLMFQRARQLRAGARPHVDARGHTVVRVALMEVLRGFVMAAGEGASAGRDVDAEL